MGSSLSSDANLLDDINAVVKLLFLQERMDVMKECSQVSVAVSIWNDECHSMARLTGARSPHATDFNVVVQSFQLVVRQQRVAHVDESDCTCTNDDASLFTSRLTIIAQVSISENLRLRQRWNGGIGFEKP